MKCLSSIAFFLVFLLFPCFPGFAQSMEDVVYFKNGAVVHGQVLEQWPGVSIKIESHDGTIRVYRMSDVSKIVKFDLPPENASAAMGVPPIPSVPTDNVPKTSAPSRAGKVGFGLMAGGNIASINYNASYYYLVPTGTLYGFASGCFADFGLADVISIQPELYFSMKGDSYIGYSASDHLNYVELPLLFKLNFPAGPDVRIDLLTGPSFGFLTAAYTSYLGTNYPDTGLNSTDVGWIFGVGMEISRFIVNLRYDHGLTPIVPGSIDGTNGVFSLLLGCRVVD